MTTKIMNNRNQAILNFLIVCSLFMLINCGMRPAIFNNQNSPAEKAPPKVGQIVFGENYEEAAGTNSNDDRPFKIINPRGAFKYNDPFAFVVMSEEPYGKTKIKLVLSEVSDKGSEAVVLRSTINVPDPEKHKNIANNFDKADDILAGQKSGKYRLRCFRDDTLLAEGEFSYQSAGTK